MKVLHVLNYYSPHVSGLTEFARSLAQNSLERGHRVSVVATQHSRELPRRESVEGIRVIRSRVWARVNRAVISPQYVIHAILHARRSDVVHLHLPMPEAGLISLFVKKSKIVVTYQCDASLPTLSATSRLILRTLDLSHAVAITRAECLTVTSLDYWKHSRMAKIVTIQPTVLPPPCRTRQLGTPAHRHGEGTHVGFLGRLGREKGLSNLISAFERMQDSEARLLIAGPLPIGSEALHATELLVSATTKNPSIQYLGQLSDDEIADFFASIDVLALLSDDALEAFGIVQAESILLGVPVVASNRPGMRVPIAITRLGVLVDPHNADEVAQALALAKERFADQQDQDQAMRIALAEFGYKSVVDRYEHVIQALGCTKYRSIGYQCLLRLPKTDNVGPARCADPAQYGQ